MWGAAWARAAGAQSCTPVPLPPTTESPLVPLETQETMFSSHSNGLLNSRSQTQNSPAPGPSCWRPGSRSSVQGLGLCLQSHWRDRDGGARCPPCRL